MFLELWEFFSRFFFFALQVINTGSFPRPLTAQQEREYLVAYHEHGDRQARAKLVEHNLRLVAHIIKKYYSNVRDQDDLISIGTIGLMKAVDTFDHTKGVRLATYGLYSTLGYQNNVESAKNPVTMRVRGFLRLKK